MNIQLFRLQQNLLVDECLITTSTNNIRYISGAKVSDDYLVVTKHAAYLFVDSRYTESAGNELREGIELIPYKSFDDIKAILKTINVVKVDEKSMTVDELETLKKKFGDNYEFVMTRNILEKLRSIKYPEEVKKIKKAQAIAEAAFDHILSFIDTDKTEIDIALELEVYMRRNGAESVAFDTIVASGKNSSKPHAVPTGAKIKKGFLTMDFGAVYEGYCSDMTRTVSVGKASEEMKKVYNTVLEAQKKAEEAVAPGIMCCDIDKIARDIIDKKYKGTFGHGLGHGVGVFIHENPRFSPKCKEITRPGQVITVEPGIYIPGKYGVRIEDMVLVTDNGCEVLTNSPRELIEICT